MKEKAKWKKIIDFPGYLISDKGEVFSNYKKTPLKILTGGSGAQYVSLSLKGRTFNLGIAKLLSVYFPKRRRRSATPSGPRVLTDRDTGEEFLNRGDLIRHYNERKNKVRGVYKFEVKKDGVVKHSYWRAVVKYNGKAKTLGYYKDRDDATFRFLSGYKELYGQYPFDLNSETKT